VVLLTSLRRGRLHRVSEGAEAGETEAGAQIKISRDARERQKGTKMQEGKGPKAKRKVGTL